MKRILTIMVAMPLTALMLTSCHRNYKVIHARPVVDSTIYAADSAEAVQASSMEDEMKSWEDEPLIDIPDAPQEEDIVNAGAQARKEYDDYIHGR